MMTDKERDALVNFMINTLNSVHPYHDEYPFAEIREIDELEGDESQNLNKYADYILRAFYMKKDIEIIRGHKIW